MALSRVTGFRKRRLYDCDPDRHLHCIYNGRVLWHETGCPPGFFLCGTFFVLLAYFSWRGEMRYIVETGLTSLGNLSQNFIPLATWTDALRTSSFPQNWTSFLLGLLDGVVRGDSGFLSAASARDVPYGRPFWVDISSDCPAPLLLLSFLEITGCPFRCMEGWI